MDNNNILAAPQIADVDTFYKEWRRNHVGSRKVFYNFMTTPTPERDRFLVEQGAVTEFSGAVVTTTLKISYV